MRNTHASLTAAQEQDLAQQILSAEEDLSSLIRTTPARRLLSAPLHDARSRTRHAATRRLTAAVEATSTMALSATARAEIHALWRRAQEMVWKLAMSALPVARQEARRARSTRVALEDLEQESVLGLLAAARRFEPGRGVRFAAYARWWVRAQITTAIQHGEAFGISAGAVELHRNLGKLIHADAQAGTRRPASEHARELGVAPERLDVVAAAVRCHAAGGAEGDDPILAQLPDHHAPTPEQQAIDANIARSVRRAIATKFSEREQHILHHRYGLGAEQTSTETIARALSLSPERVRQVEQQCVSMLRSIYAREMDI